MFSITCAHWSHSGDTCFLRWLRGPRLVDDDDFGGHSAPTDHNEGDALAVFGVSVA